MLGTPPSIPIEAEPQVHTLSIHDLFVWLWACRVLFRTWEETLFCLSSPMAVAKVCLAVIIRTTRAGSATTLALERKSLWRLLTVVGPR